MKYILIYFLIQTFNCNLTITPIRYCESGNCINGTGILKVGSSGIYDGLFRDGYFIFGTNISHENCMYKGEFFGFARNGYGIEDCNDIIHDGYWKMGLAHGEGTVIFEDKKKFSGLWNEDYLCFIGNCKEGFGILVIAYNGYYIGEFKEGKATGKGIKEKHLLNNYYSVYIGDHLELRSHGFGIQIDEDGVKKGKFEDNRFVDK
jgi:hypothetical protein